MRTIAVILLMILTMMGFSTNKYWKPLNGNSNVAANWATDTTSWTSASAVPSASDNIFFTKAAGNVTCTVVATMYCLNFDCRGWGGSITASTAKYIYIYGDIYFGGTANSFIQIYHANTSGTKNIQSGGIIWGGSIDRVGAGGTSLFVDNFSIYDMAVEGGTLNTNGKVGKVNNIAIWWDGDPSVINLGASDITVNGSNGVDFLTNGSNFTFICGTSTIHLSGNYTTCSLKGNGKTFYNVYFDATIGGGTISGSNIFHELKFSPYVANKTFKFTDGTTQTITTFTADGSGVGLINLTGTSTNGWTLSKSSGTVTVDYVNLSYSTGSGGATWGTGCNSINNGNNTNWVFPNCIQNKSFFWSPF